MAEPSQGPRSQGVVDRDVLVSFLDDYLESDQKDYGPNGLQVEGRPEIRKIVTGVSACEELFHRAVDVGADAVLVHHGIFWKGMSSSLTGYQFRRVKALIDNGLNLVAYHLPLDRHPEVGNNALAARALGLVDLEPFAYYQGQPTGFKGRFSEPTSIRDWIDRSRAFYGQEPLVFPEGPDPLRTLGIVSGGAQRELYTAVDEGLDAFVTGEVSEWVMNIARETGTHYMAAGHYATERCGIQRLGELVAEHFELDVTFIDLPNPV